MRYIILFTVLLVSVSGFAQITGQVKDTANRPVAYANVLLFQEEDSVIECGAMANEAGKFSIIRFKPGTYFIGVSSLGYKQAFSGPFEIKSSDAEITRGTIFLAHISHQFKDINVVAKMPVYQHKIDRMIVNVENNLTSSGSTVLEVLEKSPGVIVDRQNNNISILGKKGVSIIINGKQNRMPVAAAVQMLSAMSAENIKRIEIITNPPAKYDAEGDAGIINIVLKKNENTGTSGSFILGAGIAKHEKMNGSINLNHRTENINYFGMYNLNYNNLQQNYELYRQYIEEGSMVSTDAGIRRDASLIFQNFRTGFDYDFSNKTVLSLTAAGYLRNWNMDAFNTTDYSRNSKKYQQSRLNTSELNRWTHAMVHSGVKHSFEEGNVLEVNIDYLYYCNNNPSNYTLKSYSTNDMFLGEEIDVNKKTPINIGVVALDCSNQINPKLKLEAGIKGTLSQFKNDVYVRFFTGDNWSVDPELTNRYQLNENINAAYTSWLFQPTDKIRVVAGMRYEFMNVVLDSQTEEAILDLHYGEFFPTLFASDKLNEKSTLQFSYGRRISRPTFNELAPFIIFMTPESFFAGNEKLLPATSNKLKLDYIYKSISVSANYIKTKNAIVRFQPVNWEDSMRQYYVSRNFESAKNYSLMLTFPVTVCNWWQMQNNFSWFRNEMNTDFKEVNFELEQNSFRMNSTQNFLFNERWSAEVSGFYQSKSMSGFFRHKPFGRLDFGIQWNLKNGKSKLNLNFTDVFNTNIYRWIAEIPELNIYTRWMLDFESRVLRLSFTHNFGKERIISRKRNTASEEEQKRVSP